MVIDFAKQKREKNVSRAVTIHKTVVADVSKPPTGKCKVTNLFVNPETGKLIIEYDDKPI